MQFVDYTECVYKKNSLHLLLVSCYKFAVGYFIKITGLNCLNLAYYIYYINIHFHVLASSAFIVRSLTHLQLFLLSEKV